MTKWLIRYQTLSCSHEYTEPTTIYESINFHDLYIGDKEFKIEVIEE